MTRTELWSRIYAKNNLDKVEAIRFTPEKLERFFNYVWDEAEAETWEGSVGPAAGVDVPDFLKGLFGGKFGK